MNNKINKIVRFIDASRINKNSVRVTYRFIKPLRAGLENTFAIEWTNASQTEFDKTVDQYYLSDENCICSDQRTAKLVLSAIRAGEEECRDGSDVDLYLDLRDGFNARDAAECMIN